ncbi:unnamed protein product [Anisakis simplex]|uniref:Chondroitin proteoglycan 4 (inferred by orthology to a C. elegans protein) n=1 Tax=Anisakis simplex TaxID=6269 RepID=A0A0M3J484_ANISI|nr:unnamed protein product [Anisakis simplex]
MPKDKAQNQKNATKDRQMMGSVGDLLTENEKLLSVAGAELPDCFEGCNKYFAKTVDVAIKSGNHYERYQNVCFRFKEASKCLEQMKHCGSYELFDVLTSGLKYMCIDQKGECSKDCNVEGILAGWGVYAGLRQTSLFTPQGITMLFIMLTDEIQQAMPWYGWLVAFGLDDAI